MEQKNYFLNFKNDKRENYYSVLSIQHILYNAQEKLTLISASPLVKQFSPLPADFVLMKEDSIEAYVLHFL